MKALALHLFVLLNDLIKFDLIYFEIANSGLQGYESWARIHQRA